jgi:hypothetical protein
MDILLLLHSIMRYLVLIGLLGVILNSLVGMIQAKPFGKMEDKSSLWLFIFTHTQLLIGLILYFVSPLGVSNFSSAAMKDTIARYWLVEHSLMMLIAIVLITIARISMKKLATDAAKHKRLFIFNALALLIIIVSISMSGRGFFGLPQ